MTQVPPPGGWIDPYGTPQSGYPPPGYWQASDGRWYPPESRPAQPFAAPETIRAPGPAGPAGQPGFGGPQPGYGPQGFQGQAPDPGMAGPGLPPAKASRTGLWVALGVVAALVLVGGAVLAANLGSGTDTAGTTTTTTAKASTTSANGTTASSASGSSSPKPTTGAATTGGSTSFNFGGSSKAVDDITGCKQIGDEKIEIELSNKSAALSDYSLTIALLDDAGKRLGDTTGYIDNLRPGEHAIEQVYLFDNKGTKCEVIDADRYDTASNPALLADVSACTVGQPDSLGDVTATLSATNSAAAKSDYTITVALIDPSGVRRGTGTSYIQAIRSKETAPGDIYTSVIGGKNFRCEVVGVERTDS